MSEKEYYKILQIEISSEKEQVHEAYKKLAKSYQQSESNLSDFIFRMKDLNEAYLVLSNSGGREEYDNTIKNDVSVSASYLDDIPENEDSEQEIPIELDEDSIKKLKLKVGSFSAYFESQGEVSIIGEILIKKRNNNSQYLYTYFSVYESSGKLIGTGDDWIDISRNCQTFNKTIYTKPKSSIPTKIRINFTD